MKVWFTADEWFDDKGIAHQRELLHTEVTPSTIAVRVATPEDRALYQAEYAAFKDPPPTAEQQIAELQQKLAAAEAELAAAKQHAS